MELWSSLVYDAFGKLSSGDEICITRTLRGLLRTHKNRSMSAPIASWLLSYAHGDPSLSPILRSFANPVPSLLPVLSCRLSAVLAIKELPYLGLNYNIDANISCKVIFLVKHDKQCALISDHFVIANDQNVSFKFPIVEINSRNETF